MDRTIGSDDALITMLRSVTRGIPSSDLLTRLYWDGSAVREPWFEALADAMTGFNHIRCVHMLAEYKLGPMLNIVALLAFLSKHTASAEWAHYQLTQELSTLLRENIPQARLPLALHAFLAIENFPNNDYVQSTLQATLGASLARWMPREAVRHGLLSLRMGNNLAQHELDEALDRLNLKPSSSRLDILDARYIDQAIGSSVGFPEFAINSSDSLDVTSYPLVLPKVVTHPRPEGDAHYYLFHKAGTPMPVEPVHVHRITNAAISCDLTRLGRPEFYAYGDGKCLSDLCVGMQPFLTEPEQCLQVDKPLLMVDDIFSGKPNVSHFLFDQIPRLLSYRRLEPGPVTLLRCDDSPYYQGALAALGITDLLVPNTRRFTVRAPVMFMSSNMMQRSDHPVNTGSARTASLLREAFGVTQTQPKGRRILISRTDAPSRHIINNEEVEAVFGRHGFEPVVLSGLSFAEQRDLFTEASHVAGVHGAGLSNLLFASQNCRVLEILPPLVASHAYWMLCSALGQHYRVMIAKDTELPTPDYETWTHNASYNDRDLWIDPERLDATLEAFS